MSAMAMGFATKTVALRNVLVVVTVLVALRVQAHSVTERHYALRAGLVRHDLREVIAIHV